MSVIAKRYAQALWNFAEKNSSIETIYTDVLLILETLKHHDLSETLASPVLRVTIKKNICLALFKQKIQDYTLQFLQLVADKKRLNYLKEMMQAFVILYQKKHQIYPIELTTATVLAATTQQKIEAVLTKTYPKIVPIYKINSELIGGIIIDVLPENKQMNLSVRKKLTQIRQTLMQAS